MAIRDYKFNMLVNSMNNDGVRKQKITPSLLYVSIILLTIYVSLFNKINFSCV